MRKIEYDKLSVEDLERVFMEAGRELMLRRSTDTRDPFAAIEGLDTAKRAITIAAIGKHPILFVGPTHSGKSMLVAAAAKVGVVAFEARGCQCGSLGDPKSECLCWPSSIQTWWTRVKHVRYLDTAHILVTVSPEHESQKRSHIKLANVLDDIQGAFPPPDFDTRASEDAQMILEQNTRIMKMEPVVVRKVKLVAASIAAMDKSSIIQARHIIEACDYRPDVKQVIP